MNLVVLLIVLLLLFGGGFTKIYGRRWSGGLILLWLSCY